MLAMLQMQNFGEGLYKYNIIEQVIVVENFLDLAKPSCYLHIIDKCNIHI